MKALLFKLNGVPDDEASDIRALLEDGDIPFFETSSGNWGVSLAALWLHDNSQLHEARALIDAYQKIRVERAKTEYQTAKEAGEVPSFWRGVRQNPVRSFFYLWPVAFIIFVSLTFFIGAWES